MDIRHVPALLHLGLAALPLPVTDDAARVLAAIGFKESDWDFRHQRGGSAHGYFQFEQIGVEEVFRHPRSRQLARDLLRALDYPDTLPPKDVWLALEHNDRLAVGIARLALWRHPSALPVTETHAWDQYLFLWRPGRPHEHLWPSAWRRACALYPQPV